MDEKLYLLSFIVTLAFVLAIEDPELPLCPTGVLSYLPQSLPNHCRMPATIQTQQNQFNLSYPNFLQNQMTGAPSFPPGYPMPFPGAMPMIGAPMSYYAPPPAKKHKHIEQSHDKSDCDSSEETWTGKRYRKKKHRRTADGINNYQSQFGRDHNHARNYNHRHHHGHSYRHYYDSNDHDETDERRYDYGHNDDPYHHDHGHETDSEEHVHSHEDKQVYRTVRARRDDGAQVYGGRYSKKYTRRKGDNQQEILTPLIQYVTKDGFVIFEKEISKNEAKEWLDTDKNKENNEIGKEDKRKKSNDNEVNETKEQITKKPPTIWSHLAEKTGKKEFPLKKKEKTHISQMTKSADKIDAKDNKEA